MIELIRSHQIRVEQQQNATPAYSLCRPCHAIRGFVLPSQLANRLATKYKHGREGVAIVICECKRNRDYQTNVRPKHSIFTRMVWIT